MDSTLKSLLERAENWPPEAQDELVKAAETIEEKLRDRVPQKRAAGKHHALYEALMSAPKTGQLRRLKSVRARIRQVKI